MGEGNIPGRTTANGTNPSIVNSASIRGPKREHDGRHLQLSNRSIVAIIGRESWDGSSRPSEKVKQSETVMLNMFQHLISNSMQTITGAVMIYTGIDMIEIDRIADVARRYPSRFLEKIFTPAEQAYCRGRAPQMAARFAAKEAVMKMLGTGVRGVPWKDIEVVRERGRAPEIVLHGNAKAVGERLRIHRIALSMSHSRLYAVASVVGEADDPGEQAVGPDPSPSPWRAGRAPRT